VRLFGLDSSEGMVGKLVYDTIDPEFRELAMARIRSVIEDRVPAPLSEQALVRADGSRIDVEVVSLPFDYEGKPAALSIVHDLTARKAVERATQRLNAELEDRVGRRTAALKRANEDLEAFSYTVAHDLRAPLRRVNGFAALLEESLGDAMPGDSRTLLSRIVDGGNTMDRLIEGMLEIARLGRTDLRPENIDLAALARGVAAELRERDPQRTVEFIIPPAIPVRADPRLIRGVLENLLGNAWKFTSSHAEARIEVGMLDPATQPRDALGEPVPPGLRACYVRDDGAGFDARYIDKLFGNFQRLHDNNEFPGTGIGLASVKRVIVNHGGSVWAEGAVEQGATFYFTLPAAGGE
jgi:PAS domain S-box-containing protein